MSAKQITDKSEWRETLTRTVGGWKGTKHFRVNTADATEAMLDPELPKVGDPWSARLPYLECVQVGPSEKIGGYHTGPDVGWTRVPVEYQTPDASIIRKATPDRRSWTEISFAAATDTIYRPLVRVAGGGGPPFFPINNGNGVEIPTGSIFAKVTANFATPSEVPALSRLKNLARPAKLNQEQITLPRIYGTELAYSIGPLQALYRGWEGPKLVDGYLQIVHQIELAETFLYAWGAQDDKGNLTMDTVIDQIFDASTFGGLWN